MILKKYRCFLLLLAGMLLFSSCKPGETGEVDNQIAEADDAIEEETQEVSEIEDYLLTVREWDKDDTSQQSEAAPIPLKDYPLYFSHIIPGDDKQSSIHVEIQLPQWIEQGNGIYEKMNELYQVQFEQLCQLATEKIDEYKSGASADINQDYIFTYICEESNYINNRYLQLIATSKNEGWKQSEIFPKYQIWDVLSGEMLSIDDLFTVAAEVYLPRLQTIAQQQELDYAIEKILLNPNCFWLESYNNYIFFELPPDSQAKGTKEYAYLQVACDEIEDILTEDFLDFNSRYLQGELVRHSLIQEISKFPELVETSVDFPGDNNSYKYHTGQVGLLPEGYSSHIVVLDYTQSADVRLYLFAINISSTEALLLDYLDFDGYYNSAKTDLIMEEGKIHLWSQFPFKAASSHAFFDWDGAHLIMNEVTYGDPSQAVLDNQRELLEKRDIDGLMEMTSVIFYPFAYPDYTALPKPILFFAHEEALAAYHNGDLSRAIQIIEYGLEHYYEIHYISGPKETDFDENIEHFITKEEYVLIVNNYAFFLYENGDYEQALTFLQNIVALSPDRSVAHLNLGDTYWALGEEEKAINHYKRYDELIENKDVIPDYVQQRISNEEEK